MMRTKLLAEGVIVVLLAACSTTGTSARVTDSPHNVRGDVTREYLDVLSAEVVQRDGEYELTVETAKPLPPPGEMAAGERIDCIWFIDIDRDTETGQSAKGNDYNLHLQLDDQGWRPLLYRVSEASVNDATGVTEQDIQIRVDGNRATLILPANALPSDVFDWWLHVSTLNATDDAPLTENPPTKRVTFAAL